MSTAGFDGQRLAQVVELAQELAQLALPQRLVWHSCPYPCRGLTLPIPLGAIPERPMMALAREPESLSARPLPKL